MISKTIAGLLLMAAALALVQAQEEALGPNGQPRPEPYSFSYSADASGALSSHQETGDGTGRITGVYTIAGPDGRERRVEYVADADGYRATIKTNEIGTAPSADAGDARWQVSQPSDAQLAAANQANALNPNANRPAPLASIPLRPTIQAQPSSSSSSNQDNQVPESSVGSGATLGQQREQIPSSSNNQATAQAPADESQQQQQTLVNLDDIQDAPPAPAPVQAQIQVPAAPQQAVFIQQAPVLAQPQPIFFQQQQPLPTISFQPRPPQQIVQQLAPQPQPQQQLVQIREEQQQQQQQQQQRQEQQQQEQEQPREAPKSIQAIKTQQLIEAGEIKQSPQQSASIGPGSAGQRGPELVGNLENKFGPKIPQEPARVELIEQPVQVIEQAPPAPQQQVVQVIEQQQPARIEQIQPQLIELPAPQFKPVQAPAAPQIIVPAPQAQIQQTKGGAVKGGQVQLIRQPIVVQQQQQFVPQQQIIQRIEPAPQPQLVQRFQPAPQPQIIQRIEPQPQIIQRIEPQPQFIEQPQLIIAAPQPNELEILTPNFQPQRIQPVQQQLIPIQRQPIQVQQPVQVQIQQQEKINLLPTAGLKVEPIFQQIGVKTQQPAPAPQVQQQQQAKGQIEVIPLRETPAQPEQLAPTTPAQPAPVVEKAQEEASSNGKDDSQDEEDEQPQAPATTQAPTTTTTQRPAARLVFGKTRFGAPAGTKIGTKTAPAPAAPLPAPAPLPIPAPIPVAIAPQPIRVASIQEIKAAPQPAPQQQFISFGTRLGTKTGATKSSS